MGASYPAPADHWVAPYPCVASLPILPPVSAFLLPSFLLFLLFLLFSAFQACTSAGRLKKMRGQNFGSGGISKDHSILFTIPRSSRKKNARIFRNRGHNIPVPACCSNLLFAGPICFSAFSVREMIDTRRRRHCGRQYKRLLLFYEFSILES